MENSSDTILKIEKLKDTEGYPLWRFQIDIHLEAAELLTVTTQEPTVARMAEEAWKKKYAKARKIIVSTLEKQSLIHTLSCKNSYQMYKKLKEIYERDTEHQKCKLLQDFYRVNKKSEMSMAAFISELTNIAYRLKSMGHEITDSMIMSKILSALPENYRYFASAWESTPVERKTLTNLTARLMMEETRMDTNEGDEVVFKTDERRCYKCNMKGHLARSCKTKIVGHGHINNKECFLCHKTGHLARDCKKNQGRSCRICKKTNH